MTFVNNFIETLSLNDADKKLIISTFGEVEELKKFVEQNDKLEQMKTIILIINQKFNLNRKNIMEFIDALAIEKIYFNTYERDLISFAFDSGQVKLLEDELFKIRKINKDKYLDFFKPILPQTTLDCIKNELKSDKRNDIVLSVFAAYFFKISSINEFRKFFHKKNETLLNKKLNYSENYFKYVEQFIDELSDSPKLIYLKVDNGLFYKYNKDYNEFLNMIFNFIKKSFECLSNHCFLFIKIDNIINNNYNIKWDLYSNICLFAEKFYKCNNLGKYFDFDKVYQQSNDYIHYKESISELQFKTADLGFQYKDCYIIKRDIALEQVPLIDNIKNINEILLSFQKNLPDETQIPCPACFSIDVRANSYPQIGVRSWECNNQLCPDRSKYNRGKRYSYASIRIQKGFCNKNIIEKSLLKKWMLDVVEISDDSEIIDMIVKSFSFVDDSIFLVNTKTICKDYSREIKYISCDELIDKREDLAKFLNSKYFHRFLVKERKAKKVLAKNLTKRYDIQLFHGDTLEILKSYEDNYFDGAVTSPPYYNNKEYSQWKNIYCYLYDMYNIILECYRVLKEGSIFIYNIFDTYDNENTLVFSDMGEKRLTLGAYTILLFQKAGFILLDNIIWEKGHVQGTRHTNSGNNLPFHQYPLNSWEHMFIFYKPGKPNFSDNIQLSNVKKFVPVRKIFSKGVNSYGHSAPFPEEIPNLLLDLLNDEKKIIFDPFSGSMTSGITAIKRGYKSINIEKKEEFCELSLKRLDAALKKSPSSLSFYIPS